MAEVSDVNQIIKEATDAVVITDQSMTVHLDSA